MFAVVDQFTEVQQLLTLEPEELGAVLIRHVPEARAFSPYNHVMELTSGNIGQRPDWTADIAEEAALVFTEAWAWLEGAVMIVQAPGQMANSTWYVLSRRGRKLREEGGLVAYSRAASLPRAMLHRAIAGAPWNSYLRGDYDTAVFQAMKQVEVAVRSAAGLGDELLGVKLMRLAFDVERGALTDLQAERSEREALQHLFAGAIGTFKNPQSHREVALADPEPAAEVILLASHLLRIVDGRRPT